MQDEEKRTWAEIKLGNLENNYKAIKSMLPDSCELIAVCKANSYGHGAVQIAKKLQNLGASYISVSCYKEALELRQNGVSLPIIILAPSQPELAPQIAEINAVQAVGNLYVAKKLNEEMAGSGKRLKIHIKLDTGMGRTGFMTNRQETVSDVLSLLKLENLSCEGVFTHFADSDDIEDRFTEEQHSRFVSAVEAIEKATGVNLGMRHCANSGGALNFPNTAMDGARVGLMLYGYIPGKAKNSLGLLPVMQLKTRICEIKDLSAGDSISYGRTYTCTKDTKIAVIPVGYADGLPRRVSGKMKVLINGETAKQLGTVCMDMCMVDITNIKSAQCGDIATVFGEDISLDALADAADTISYELLCAVSQRVPRVYTE